MGRWSRHPMGSDGALDAQGIFMSFADVEPDNEEEDDIYYFERPREEIRDLLLGLTLEQIKEYATQDECIETNKFVIPYTFIDYGAYPTDPKIKAYLLRCLNSHDDLTGEWNYCNGEEMKHVKYFKEHFEDIISGNEELPGDIGLLATIAEKLAQEDQEEK